MSLSGLPGDREDGDWTIVSVGSIRASPEGKVIEILEIVSRTTGQRLVVVRDCYSGTMSISPAPEPELFVRPHEPLPEGSWPTDDDEAEAIAATFDDLLQHQTPHGDSY